MIDYSPLFQTLKESNVKISEFRSLMSSATVAKIDKNDYISLKSIEKICLYLEVPIEKVIKIHNNVDSNDTLNVK